MYVVCELMIRASDLGSAGPNNRRYSCRELVLKEGRDRCGYVGLSSLPQTPCGFKNVSPSEVRVYLPAAKTLHCQSLRRNTSALLPITHNTETRDAPLLCKSNSIARTR